MSKKASPIAVGIFMVGAIIILLAGLVILGASEMFEKKERLVLYFEGSAGGLEVGSEVLLGGVKIGEVVEMRVQVDFKTNKKIIPVVIEVSPERLMALRVAGTYAGEEVGLEPPTRDTIFERERINYFVEKGLMGRFKSKSVLTGQLYVELELLPDKRQQGQYYVYEVPENETTLYGLQQIPTTPGEIEQVMESIAKSVDKLSQINIEELVAEIKADINEIKDNVNKLITDVDAKVLELDVKGISDKANSTLAKVDDLLGDEKIKSTIASIDEAAKELKDLLAAIDAEAVNGAVVGAEETIKEAGDAVKIAGDALKQIELAAKNISENTGTDAALTVRLSRTLGAIEEVSKSVKELTDYLKRNPNSILSGRKRP